MQVATLFRESATLLGASMEAGGGGAPDPTPGIGTGALSFETFNHPAANKYKLNMKLEPQDDGYETSADKLLSNTANSNEVKCEQLEDPYSFIDDDPLSMLPATQGMMHCMPSVTPPAAIVPGPKKRGRKKKIKTETGPEYNLGLNGNAPPVVKERKKHDRFNGMPEEEVSKRTLPDHLTHNLDIIIIGINPGLFAAYKGHHYAGPGNHFWKCLYQSGLTQQQMTADEDYKLLQVGIGFTNMVQRATKGSADLTRKEIKEGSQILLEKLQRYKPKIAVFNGKLIYEVFSGKKDFNFGRQPDLVDGTNTYMWVMPSSSARCAQLPRAADKVPFYAALKKFRDYLNGIVPNIEEREVVFPETKLKACYEQAHEPKTESQYSMEIMDISNAVVKKEDVPCKKKRGRPKKIKVEGEEPSKPAVRKTPSQNTNNCDFPKKKRGRPKKIKSEDTEVPLVENNTSTNISKCFSSPSPIQSPTAFYHMTPALTPPSSSSSLYAPQPPPPYSQSPRPHSQPFTHSDLSSEISAAISSEQLGSPASPSLGPPDFDPPTSMAEEPVECRFSSPAPSNTSEQQQFPSYHTFGIENENNYTPPHMPQNPQRTTQQDVASKSLSGLESLVDQIPSIAEGEALPNVEGEQYGQFPTYGSMAARASPAPHYSYPASSGYGSIPVAPLSSYPAAGGWGAHPFAEPVPLPYTYSQQFPPSYAPGLHVPSPNYPPYYNTYAPQQPHPSHPHPGYHMFDRIKPDIGYGGF